MSDDRIAHLETLYRLLPTGFTAPTAWKRVQAALDSIVKAWDATKRGPAVRPRGGDEVVAWRGLSGPLPQHARGPHAMEPGTPTRRRSSLADIRRRQKATREAGHSGRRHSQPRLHPDHLAGSRWCKFMACHRGVRSFRGARPRLAVTIARQLGFSLERARPNARGLPHWATCRNPSSASG